MLNARDGIVRTARIVAAFMMVGTLCMPAVGIAAPKKAADAKAEDAAKKDPASAERSYAAGTKAYEAGNMNEAVQQLSAALANGGLPNPQMAKALYYRGTAYRKQGKPAQAISDLTTAVWLKGGLSDSDRAQAMEQRQLAYSEAGLGSQAPAIGSAPLDAPAAKPVQQAQAPGRSAAAPPPVAPKPGVLVATVPPKSSFFSMPTMPSISMPTMSMPSIFGGGTTSSPAPEAPAAATAACTCSRSRQLMADGNGGSRGDAGFDPERRFRGLGAGRGSSGAPASRPCPRAAGHGHRPHPARWPHRARQSRASSAAFSVVVRGRAPRRPRHPPRPSRPARPARLTEIRRGTERPWSRRRHRWSSADLRSRPRRCHGRLGQTVAAAEPVSATSPAKSARAAAAGKYKLQVAAVRSREEAEKLAASLNGYQAVQTGAVQSEIDEAVIGSMGTFYRVRLGPYADATEPGQLCKTLRPQGFDCMVVTQ